MKSYEEWCRQQVAFGHHDIWWIKGQQFKAGSWTLSLIAALLGASKILWDYRENTPTSALLLFPVLCGLLAFLGGVYTWDLYHSLVGTRLRVQHIVGLVKNDYKALSGALRDARRHILFPIVISLVEVGAWGLSLEYFRTPTPFALGLPGVMFTSLLVWGLIRRKKIEREVERDTRFEGEVAVPISSAILTPPLTTPGASLWTRLTGKRVQ